MLELDVQYATDAPAPDEATLRGWTETALAGRRDEAELSIRIVDEPEGQDLNRDYRGRDYPTNVLSFPYEALPGVELPLLGDLVICAPVVAREAAEQGKALDAHWAHMLIHGCLHLLGYDHEDDAEAQVMETLERDLLASLGFPDPYASD
ncbi:rRNA maturation RNase YbeY [Alkalilimnicola sp. S0819]|uniref:rRNA maturation RNase YbeY n=1 Tax=Alkalilimnicola sp. S0819 TaxID=2613922 RepID=UPI001261B8D9|nr:rRNA maturation RNase YbeY [Alkalilimnicola sp. S0819]KAB7628258.1 rRNA maturation RNase YbeY [Alkalilimnicola sp. S0819]MPQ15152.1 rRNA maturation RNase YbeY [Alkalilimnicola sp. S0819]